MICTTQQIREYEYLRYGNLKKAFTIKVKAHFKNGIIEAIEEYTAIYQVFREDKGINAEFKHYKFTLEAVEEWTRSGNTTKIKVFLKEFVEYMKNN